MFEFGPVQACYISVQFIRHQNFCPKIYLNGVERLAYCHTHRAGHTACYKVDDLGAEIEAHVNDEFLINKWNMHALAETWQ